MRASSEQHSPNEGNPPPFFVKFLATGFYAGYSPIAPGTAGTIIALIVYALPSFEQSTNLSIAIVVGFLFGVYGSTRMEESLGHDPTVVVIDEMVGMWISLFLLPKTFLVVLGSFILFRVLDIVKPPPAKSFQKKGGGFSIMMDDAIAGIYTNLFMHLAIFSSKLL